MPEFTCPTNKRTANGNCGTDAVLMLLPGDSSCYRCCLGCSHAQDMTCSFVCSFVAEHYHGSENDEAKDGEEKHA